LSSQAIDRHGAEFHSLDQVHGDDRYAVHSSFDLVGQLDGSGLDATSGAFNCPSPRTKTPISSGSIASAIISANHSHECHRFSIGIGEGLDDGFDAVEG
jgi:hypothetical protein